MVLIAGLREVGSTPDTDAYEMMFYGMSRSFIAESTEPTFTWIASFLRAMSLGVNSLFITYALISVIIHIILFDKMSKMPFLTLTIYVSYYYMMHEMVQIRAGVAAGLFLWAVYYYVEKNRLAALACIVIGFFFHYSAAAGLVLFLMRDKLPQWQKIILYALVPIGLIAYFTNLDFSYLVPDELGGDKLALYRKMKERGVEDDLSGWPLEGNILIWMNIVLYYASIFYSDYLTKYCKYVPIAIKVQAVGFFFLFFAHGVSAVLGNRMNDYYSIVSIILWTASVYAFYPRMVGRVVNLGICTFRFVTSMLGYALSLLFL